MATPILMPKVGISVESCILTKWHKKKGETVAKGEVLFTFETDKSTIDEVSPLGGILLETYFKEGDEVVVLVNVAVIGETGEDFSSFAPSVTAEVAEICESDAKKTATAIVAETKQEYIKRDSQELFVSPRARILAEKHGVDISLASPTGAEGRIVEADIIRVIEGFTASGNYNEFTALGTGIGGRIRSTDKAAEGEYVLEKASNIRKFIAKSMHESLSKMAQLTLNSSFDASKMLAYRKKLKGTEGSANITINDIVLYVVSRVLVNHKYVNAHFDGENYKFFKKAHIGMAVDTEKGLLVPTIFNADELSLTEISAKAKEVAVGAQKGGLSPDLLKGGTFTVTNLGVFGIESFTPVINPPQTCILGVCGLTDRIKIVDGVIKPYKAMGLSLTFDHRALDGAPAARFLKDICESIENFDGEI